MDFDKKYLDCQSLILDSKKYISKTSFFVSYLWIFPIKIYLFSSDYDFYRKKWDWG